MAEATTAPAVTFKNLPEGAKVVVKLNGYNVPSEAFMGWGEGGVFSLALNPEGVVNGVKVTPTIGEGVDNPFVVGEGAVTVAVKAIPGLKYELRRGVKIGSGGIIDPALPGEPVVATGTTVTLTDANPPNGGAFYRVVVSVP